uniref:Uncharacterized protein C1orf109-like n=1 Tax=Phallusia mammillata TaxID=59560 RepID=A0A6F9D7E6_9ASCI|nr:uncharacterized protein C1orf109-like [Phallusia mammillata]
MENVRKTVCKSLKTVKKHVDNWDTICAECEPVITSLLNLSTQLDCCQKVDLTNHPLGGFDDLKENLSTKLMLDVDTSVNSLLQKLKILSECRNRIRRVTDTCNSLLKSVNTVKTTIGTATEPPHSDIVEWLNNLVFIATEQYAEKRDIITNLQMVEFNTEFDACTIKDNLTAWKNHKDLHSYLHDILKYCENIISLDS